MDLFLFLPVQEGIFLKSLNLLMAFDLSCFYIIGLFLGQILCDVICERSLQVDTSTSICNIFVYNILCL